MFRCHPFVSLDIYVTHWLAWGLLVSTGPGAPVPDESVSPRGAMGGHQQGVRRMRSGERRGHGRAGWRRGMRGGAALAAVLLASGCAIFGKGKRESPQVVAAREAEEARNAAQPALAGARLRVEVLPRREVALHGSVVGLGALRCAVTNAELVQGVTLVIDHVVLERGPAEARCLAPRVFRGAVAAAP